MTTPELPKLSVQELRCRIEAGLADQRDYRNVAAQLAALDEYEDAAKYYEAAMSLSQHDIEKAGIGVALATVFGMMNERAEMQRLAENAVALLSHEDESIEVLLIRGSAYVLLAECAATADAKRSANMARLGLDALERVLARSTDREALSSACGWAVRSYMLLGDTEKTISLCKRYFQYEWDERERIECQVALIEALRIQGRFTEAEQVIDEVYRYLGTNTQCAKADKRVAQRVELERGLIQRLSHRLSDAATTFQHMLREMERNPNLQQTPIIPGMVWWNLASVLYESADFRSAATAFEKASIFYSASEPDHYTILVSLGDCYLGLGAYAKARECYDQVCASLLGQKNDKLLAGVGKAKIMYESREYQKAASSFEKILLDYQSGDPNFYNILLWLGYCYDGMWLQGKARHCYEDVRDASCAWEADKASAEQALKRLLSTGGNQSYSC